MSELECGDVISTSVILHAAIELGPRRVRVEQVLVYKNLGKGSGKVRGGQDAKALETSLRCCGKPLSDNAHEKQAMLD